MPLEDLDLILNKEAIIATFPVSFLSSNPEQVEQIYRAHARTHISLGDTARYVDAVFKWVGGSNLGGFIGGVAGGYGHGKTSFQVHIWDQCEERKVFAVPPFEWERVTDLVDGVSAWVQHILAKTHAELALAAKKSYESYREKSLQELAEETARHSGRNVDDVLKTYTDTVNAGGTIGIQTSPERFLDYCTEVTEVLGRAGYSGLLVMLDEPEVAAKTLGTAKVSQILFDIANGLMSRQGDYGVFVSMPENFLAQAQAAFAALPARLQGRNCFPRLRDIYGSDFARTLWQRYVEEFSLGEIGTQAISEEALQAIGQVASSERNDLSYGPRTVVSAFRRMVFCYKDRGTAYLPSDFVRDCLDGEILVSDYPTRVREILDSPEAEGIDKALVTTLAAFPNGVTLDLADRLGIDTATKDFLIRRPNLVYKRGNLFGLVRLQRQAAGADQDELRDTLVDIASEFAPNPATFASARDAFIRRVIPRIFEPRQGQQLQGWEIPEKWNKVESDTRAAELVGAFMQTTRDFPKRTVAVAVGPYDADPGRVFTEVWAPDSPIDIVVHFRIRWSKDDPMPEQRIEVSPGDPEEGRPGVIRLILDFADNAIDHPGLEEVVGKVLLNPLGALYLISEKHKRTLSRDYEAQWSALQEQLLRELLTKLLGDPQVRQQASEQVGQHIPGDALALIGSVCRFILLSRYHGYSTLIRQPQWEQKVNQYVVALKNADIPLSCKRGREPWIESGDAVARVFNTSRMNLTGGAFAGFENLITIKPADRNDLQVDFKLHPLEEAIIEKITTDNPLPKKKFGGVECWCVPFEDVKSVMLCSGYSLDELLQIVEIGKSRGSFETAESGGKPVLFCRPLDLDQMKTQLSEKLTDLQAEIDEFKKLPEFPSSFDSAATKKAIDGLKDEAQYDSLQTRMNREFELMHSRLPNYFERLKGDIEGVQTSANNASQTLRTSPEVARIQNPPKGSSKWASDLNTYILVSLKAAVKDAAEELQRIQAAASKALIEHSVTKLGRPLEKVALLLHGWVDVGEMRQQMKDAQSKASAVMNYLRDYDQWLRLLARSDEVYREVIELKKETAHVGKASELIGKLDTIWADISGHLQTRNVTGLGSYKQYFQQLDTLDEERRKYIQELRSAFEEQKKVANELLQELDLGSDYRCREVFNSDDIQGCYARLYSEATKHVQEAIGVERQEADSQHQELLYTRDILGQIPADEADPMLAQLGAYSQSLDSILDRAKPGWFKELVSDGNEDKAAIKEALKGTRDAVRSIRLAIRKPLDDQDDQLTSDAKVMLDMISDGPGVNLKQIILRMMQGGRSSGDVLNISLDGLVELFRKSKIQITVERPKK
ncbi:MAG: hypothetical protein HYX78_01885 [Armatimonadetes bacterium]|nr:hypothetical protein [Armatimonadota bacterium]